MKICFLVNATAKAVTGPKNSVTLLASSIERYTEHSTKVISSVTEESFIFNGVEIIPYTYDTIRSSDIVVFSGVWDLNNLRVYRKLQMLNIPYVISPRGALMKPQLAKSTLKKVLFIIGGGYKFIAESNSIHFLSQDEKAKSFFNAKSFVCGNIVDRFLFDIKPKEKGRKIGFLGRYVIHHKGLDVLLDSIYEIKGFIKSKGWSFCFHGSDNRNELEKLKVRTRELGIEGLVQFEGPLYGTDKLDFLKSLSVFVHTSRYEGQPQAVMEAMSNGCAILATPGANMSSIIEESGCGLVCEFNKKSISEGIMQLINEAADLIRMQSSSINYSISNFTGKAQANRFVENIERLLC